MVKAEPQDDSKATLARKINPKESWLSFDEAASVLHNKDWPGTRAKVIVFDHKSGQQNIVELKIINTRIYSNNNIQSCEIDDVNFHKRFTGDPM